MKVAFDFIYGMLIVLTETITLKKKTMWVEGIYHIYENEISLYLMFVINISKYMDL